MNLKECDLRLNLKLSDLMQDMDEGNDWVNYLDFKVSGFRLFRMWGK